MVNALWPQIFGSLTDFGFVIFFYVKHVDDQIEIFILESSESFQTPYYFFSIGIAW